MSAACFSRRQAVFHHSAALFAHWDMWLVSVPALLKRVTPEGGAGGPLPPVVTWDPGSLHPVTLQPSCCLWLYVQKLGVRSVCSSWGKLKGGGGALGKPRGRSSSCYLVPVSFARTESLVSAWLQGSWAVGLLSRKLVSEKGSTVFWWVTGSPQHSSSASLFQERDQWGTWSPVYVVRGPLAGHGGPSPHAMGLASHPGLPFLPLGPAFPSPGPCLSSLETLPCPRSCLATPEVPFEDVSFLVCAVGRVCSFTCSVLEPAVALGIKRRCWSVSTLISPALCVELPQKHSSPLVSVSPVCTMSCSCQTLGSFFGCGHQA